MRTIKNRIEEIKTNGYTFGFDDTLNRAFAAYKAIALPGGIVFLLFGIVYFAVMSMTAASTLDMSRVTPDMNFEEMLKELQFQLEHQTLQHKVIDGLSRILLGALSIPLSAGLIRMCYDFEKGQEISLGSAFQYYKGAHFSDLFVAGFVINLVTFAAALGSEYLLPLSPGVTLVLFLLIIAVSILTTLFVPLIIFGDQSPIESIVSSAVVVSRKFWPILFLLLVCGIIALLGLLACCIGLFFTLPIVSACQYAIYAQSVGIDDATTEPS